jgi:hypothetical protein
LPGFGYQIFAEAVVGFFGDDAKAGLFVDVTGGVEFALGPQDD